MFCSVGFRDYGLDVRHVLRVITRNLGVAHRPLSNSFFRLPYRIQNVNHKKELLSLGAYGYTP